mmetsp:Transcript_18481/g.25977  ORF Transcript_18481/g.25977 Transcript_18481/m.25977 type:complete len:96 (-) Transcript_18481:21-308(-)
MQDERTNLRMETGARFRLLREGMRRWSRRADADALSASLLSSGPGRKERKESREGPPPLRSAARRAAPVAFAPASVEAGPTLPALWAFLPNLQTS